jgi:hypothetical protein
MQPNMSLPLLQEPPTCPRPETYQSSPCPLLASWRSVFKSYSQPRLGLPSGLLPSGLLNQILYAPLLSRRGATSPAHHLLFDLITRIIFCGEYRSLSSSSCSLLHYPVSLSLLGPNILLSTTFSNTLSLCSSVAVTDQVPHPCKRRKVTHLHTLVFILLHSNPEDKRFCTEC